MPFGDKAMPAYLHMPRKPAAGEKLPLCIQIGGMDSSKENYYPYTNVHICHTLAAPSFSPN